MLTPNTIHMYAVSMDVLKCSSKSHDYAFIGSSATRTAAKLVVMLRKRYLKMLKIVRSHPQIINAPMTIIISIAMVNLTIKIQVLALSQLIVNLVGAIWKSKEINSRFFTKQLK